LEKIAQFDDNKQVYLDFAHTPDGLQNSLTSLKCHGKKNISVVFGCGGDRDKEKRPLMGRIASLYADHVIVTDDNPRFEDPSAIRNAILSGCILEKDVQEIANRKIAIEQALYELKPNNCLLIAGKGHETTQSIQGVDFPFSDRYVVFHWLKALHDG
jgi:UDP-N-acetylmuramyl tripeptide synthase